MDQQLIDRIYESSFVPELWPDVLDELGRIAEATGGTLFITKAEVQYWTASHGIRERAEKLVNEGWFWRGQFAARAFAARHAGFLTELDIFTLMNWIWSRSTVTIGVRRALAGLSARLFRSLRVKT